MVGVVAAVAVGALVVLRARHRTRAGGLLPDAPGGRAHTVADVRLRGPSIAIRIERAGDTWLTEEPPGERVAGDEFGWTRRCRR